MVPPSAPPPPLPFTENRFKCKINKSRDFFFLLGEGNHDTVYYTQFAGKTDYRNVKHLWRSIDIMIFSL